jgi:hypothetical protein
MTNFFYWTIVKINLPDTCTIFRMRHLLVIVIFRLSDHLVTCKYHIPFYDTLTGHFIIKKNLFENFFLLKSVAREPLTNKDAQMRKTINLK